MPQLKPINPPKGFRPESAGCAYRWALFVASFLLSVDTCVESVKGRLGLWGGAQWNALFALSVDFLFALTEDSDRMNTNQQFQDTNNTRVGAEAGDVESIRIASNDRVIEGASASENPSDIDSSVGLL